MIASPYRSVARTCCLVLGCALLVAAGCERSSSENVESETKAGAASSSQGPDATQTSSRESSSSDEETPRLVESDELPDNPTRIVSLAPNITEMLFALGAGERVVAVTKYCDYPKAATDLPSIGSFSNPDFETIVAKKPDLVVGVVSGGNKQVFERLKGVDIPYLFVRTDTLEETFEAIEEVGNAIGNDEAGKSLNDEIEKELKGVRRKLNRKYGAPIEEPPEVLLVYGHDPLVAAGPETFGNQLLRLAAADNVLGESDTPFPRLDIEKVVELNPDRIIDTAMVGSDDKSDFWASHPEIEAVEKGRVRYLTDPVVLRPGPRLPEAFERISKAVYGSAGSEDAEPTGGER